MGNKEYHLIKTIHHNSVSCTCYILTTINGTPQAVHIVDGYNFGSKSSPEATQERKEDNA